jgi:D-amino-acid dehydrogenase
MGLSTAVFLQRAGHEVSVIDPLPVGNGASYGNSAMISAEGSMPIAMPGMLRQVPGWLLDPAGPLSVNPRYFFKALPWLLKWVGASRMAAVRQSFLALRALHEPAIEQYRQLLGQEHFNDLIRVSGQLHVWDSPEPSRSEQVAQSLREAEGVPVHFLTPGELRDLVPQISPQIRRALLFPKCGRVVNPLRLTQTICDLLGQAGGRVRHERVMGVFPQDGGFRVLTNIGDSFFDKVVVAAGAWSRKILDPLDVYLPLETERGYHIQIARPSFELGISILHKGKGFGAAPLETGLRIAGSVEIAGLDHPPGRRREAALLKNAKELFPSLAFDSHAFWLGFRPSLPDSIPVLGECNRHPGLYIACGHGHTGLTAGAVSGRLISQLIAQTPPIVDPYPYRLSRFRQ